MRLERLLGEVDVLDLRGDPALAEVSSVTSDSRAAGPGALFCCLRGEHADGHDFADAAVAAGATALLVDRRVRIDTTRDREAVQVVVADTRSAVGPLAAAFHGHPSRHLTAIAVTGTNGKTTTTHLVRAVLEAAGRPAGIIGTLSGARTTPEATDLQAQLAGLVTSGCAAAAIEVSSHALVQHRVDGTWFGVAVFTNLSRDHLDYHPSMEDYFAAKASLFTPERAGVAVVNQDDRWGRRLLDGLAMPAYPFSAAEASDVEVGASSVSFGWRGERVRLRMGGVFNVANAVAAATVGVTLGLDPGVIAEGLSAAPPVPGRFEAVEEGQPFVVVVDFAHTPASLERALDAARRIAVSSTDSPGRVISVFGCGGDRDSGKRPEMGRVATDLSDVAVLTSDNPRTEDPAAIIEQVRAGVVRDGVLVVEPDRTTAIARALEGARAGDVVVLAGKGHETAQLIGDEVIPFDDREVARRLLASRAW